MKKEIENQIKNIKGINDLKKIRLTLKKEDKEAANVLTMLFDIAQKISKEVKEEINIEHLKTAVKKYLKMIEEAEKAGMKNEKEKNIILMIKDNIFPKQLGDEQIKHIVLEMINEIEDKSKIKMGSILGKLKQIYKDEIDMKKASQIVNEFIKKF